MKHDKEDNVRLFIAVLPDENVRSALTDAQDALRMHQFTGRYAFIGEYPDADHVLETMAQVPVPPMTLTLGGYIGNFGDLLWAGADRDPVLAQYVKSLRHVLADQQIPFERMEFNPHITLARRPVIPGGVHLSGIEVPPASMTVREVCLYRSDHTEHGMAYTVIGRGSPCAAAD